MYGQLWSNNISMFQAYHHLLLTKYHFKPTCDQSHYSVHYFILIHLNGMAWSQELPFLMSTLPFKKSSMTKRHCQPSVKSKSNHHNIRTTAITLL